MANGGQLRGDVCYTVILASSVTYERALELCADNDGKPADINSREVQNTLASLVRSKMTSHYVQLWLGMTYKPPVSCSLCVEGARIVQNLVHESELVNVLKDENCRALFRYLSRLVITTTVSNSL